MGYILIENFSGGVDRTRPRSAGLPGTLWAGTNGHLTRGGDFEKRKAFVASYALPVGDTKGMAKTSAGLYVFGHKASGALVSAMPSGVTYMQLAHPTSPAIAIDKIQSWDLFNGKLYVIVKFANGDVRHYYDGAHVTKWNSGGTTPVGYGSIVKTHKRKVYSPIVSILWGSATDSATDFDTASSGSFWQNMSTHQSGSDQVTALGVYQENLAIFARRVIQIWNMTTDPANNAPGQTVGETGTRAARSVISFGDMDVFYLSDSGVRSLRARSGTNIAGVNDVGTPIDTLIREFISTLADADVESAISLVEPVDGRYWLSIGNRVFVFSYFPSKKISAWSWYEPGVTFTDLVTINDRVYARAGDTIYLYGGSDNATYDSCTVTAAMPFLAGGKPGTFKQIKGVDANTVGTWSCKLLVNPRDENEYVDVGEVSGFTFIEDNIGALGNTTHIAPVFVNEAAGAASISQFGIYNDATGAE